MLAWLQELNYLFWTSIKRVSASNHKNIKTHYNPSNGSRKQKFQASSFKSDTKLGC